VQDLAKPAGPSAVVKAALADGEAIGILVNNAGVIDVGPFAASAIDKIVGLVNLNVRALTELTGLLLPPMVERGFGRVLNVASLAASSRCRRWRRMRRARPMCCRSARRWPRS
jgi:short-subunit dehydrogenase